MTGIKGMQIGKNESCSLLFVLKAATQYWRQRVRGKEVADAIWKEKCPFQGIYSSKHHHQRQHYYDYCGWVGMCHTTVEAAQLDSQNTFLCVVTLSLFRSFFMPFKSNPHKHEVGSFKNKSKKSHITTGMKKKLENVRQVLSNFIKK